MTYQWPAYYREWSEKRLVTLDWYYGKKWFQGKKVLELGCGHGMIGLELDRWGAKVTMTDSNSEYVEAVKLQAKHPTNVDVYNCNEPWPLQWWKNFDMIINFGLLYHVQHPELLLENCLKSCDRMVLDTKLLAYGQVFPEIYKEDGTGDGAFNQLGTKISLEWVERTLGLFHAKYQRINPHADVAEHIHYDWYDVTNAKHYPDRAFWLISTGETSVIP